MRTTDYNKYFNCSQLCFMMVERTVAIMDTIMSLRTFRPKISLFFAVIFSKIYSPIS